MPGGGDRGGEARTRAVVYCVVPRDLAAKLHEPLRRHFAGEPGVEVVVEHRSGERRRAADRRATDANAAIPPAERRRIRGEGGRRVADRRAAAISRPQRPLPRRAQRHAERLTFVERLEPSAQEAEDADTARLVTRVQAGDANVFADVYLRYFDRVYSYVQLLLRDQHEAEDLTQQVFLRAFEALPRYERRSQPFRFWLFTIVRTQAINQLEKSNRLELRDPHELHNGGDPDDADHEAQLEVLTWITDRELLLFIERLPVVQRQVLLLRYMLDLSHAEIAAVLGRTPVDVRSLQSRAVRFLRKRLDAVGRGPSQRRRTRMRTPLKQAPVLRKRRFALLPR